MTILTKPSNDKKAIKIPLPLGIGAIGQDHMEKSLLGVSVFQHTKMYNIPKIIVLVKN